jgi:hypothetical protein
MKISNPKPKESLMEIQQQHKIAVFLGVKDTQGNWDQLVRSLSHVELCRSGDQITGGLTQFIGEVVVPTIPGKRGGYRTRIQDGRFIAKQGAEHRTWQKSWRIRSRLQVPQEVTDRTGYTHILCIEAA